MALIQYSFRSEVLKENTEIYVILPTYEVFRDPEKKGAETYYKEYERKKTLYVLHGGSDDASLYLRRTRLEEYALERDLAWKKIFYILKRGASGDCGEYIPIDA